MTRQEQVQNLAKIARISVSYAEDLYDSFFPKPIVPQYVADWYEEHKNNLNSEIYYLIRCWEAKERTSDFYKWFDDTKNEAIKTLVNMHQLGYDVEECLTIAYNDIKDRKGVMIDDNFVKEK